MGTVRGKFWALIVISGKRQYAGNAGYEDDYAKSYPYDSDVANSKRVSRGDIVLLRDRNKLLGVARVERVTSREGPKKRYRCPHCGTATIRERKTLTPRWRCEKGHLFDVRSEETVTVTKYKAHFWETFRSPGTLIPASEIKSTAPRPNDQQSIEELEPDRLMNTIGARMPYLASLFADAVQTRTILPYDADQHSGNAQAEHQPSAQRRDDVLRTIRVRRGQKAFRNRLIKRYGPKCMVSGCCLVDIVEAAHIWPYRHSSNNRAENGLLLRSDLHTLFDLNHLGIDPVSFSVHISPAARKAGYEFFHGSILQMNTDRGPNRSALTSRWDAFIRPTRDAVVPNRND